MTRLMRRTRTWLSLALAAAQAVTAAAFTKGGLTGPAVGRAIAEERSRRLEALRPR